jgi:hypothetical protein
MSKAFVSFLILRDFDLQSCFNALSHKVNKYWMAVLPKYILGSVERENQTKWLADLTGFGYFVCLSVYLCVCLSI